MTNEPRTLAVRAVSAETRKRLVMLRTYTRLTCGSIIDDAIDALWTEYLEEGHEIDGS